MPQGDKRGKDWEFFDATYDGHWESELRRGLGQLTDGKIGPDNFKTSYYDGDRGQGWVGWRNDSRGGQPVEIKFEFDHIREFSAVHIYCNNQFTHDVQVRLLFFLITVEKLIGRWIFKKMHSAKNCRMNHDKLKNHCKILLSSPSLLLSLHSPSPIFEESFPLSLVKSRGWDGGRRRCVVNTQVEIHDVRGIASLVPGATINRLKASSLYLHKHVQGVGHLKPWPKLWVTRK